MERGILAGAIVLFCIFLWAQNNWLVEKTYVLSHARIASPMRIVHLSDLHAKQFGAGGRRLLRRVRRQKPDLIAFTGDLVDRFRLETDAAYDLMRELAALAPVVYCPGNHEYGRRDREQILVKLQACGVVVLRQQIREMQIAENRLVILGADEIGYGGKSAEQLAKLEQSGKFRLLLAHFPHYFDSSYSRYAIDLVLCGHAHGGQFWFPGGGVYAPGQGLFPKYCKGMHQKGETSMIVSRGLGNSGFPLRLLNFPQIVVVELLPEQK